jgi:hypothetical protein
MRGLGDILDLLARTASSDMIKTADHSRKAIPAAAAYI